MLHEHCSVPYRAVHPLRFFPRVSVDPIPVRSCGLAANLTPSRPEAKHNVEACDEVRVCGIRAVSYHHITWWLEGFPVNRENLHYSFGRSIILGLTTVCTLADTLGLPTLPAATLHCILACTLGLPTLPAAALHCTFAATRGLPTLLALLAATEACSSAGHRSRREENLVMNSKPNAAKCSGGENPSWPK